MSHDHTRGPGRPRLGSEDKRERILHEASELFSRRGYAEASLADVARAAEISKPGLLHHFRSKEVLLSAVLERRDAADFRDMGTVRGDVWTFLDWWVELVDRNAHTPEMVGLYTVMAVGGADPTHPAHAWLHRHFEDGVSELQKQLERGKVTGVVAPDAPSRELARSVLALSDGIQVQWLCARADAAGAGLANGGTTPLHGGEPIDMAAQVRLLVDMIKTRWAR